MKDKYPTWNRVRAGLVVSDECVDGVADFMIMRDGQQWWTKWRTSAGLSGPYKSAAEAMRHIESQFQDRERNQ